MQVQQCNKCFEFKSLDDFHLQNSRTGRKERKCVDCRREQERERRRLVQEAKKNETNNFEYIVPKLHNPTYPERIAQKVAEKKIKLSDLKFDLKQSEYGQKIYPIILNILSTWKKN